MRELLHDPQLMRELLRNRLLRAAVSAASLLDRAARGKYFFSSSSGDDFKSAVALARLAPQLIGDLEEKKPSEFWHVTMWLPEKVPFWEMMWTDVTREDFGDFWVRSYKIHGATANYSTMAEARAYGHKRFDDPKILKKPEPISPPSDEQFRARKLNQYQPPQEETEADRDAWNEGSLS